MSNYTQRPVNTSDISLYNHIHPVQNSFGLNGGSNQFEVLEGGYGYACLKGHSPTTGSCAGNSYAEVQSSGSDWYADHNSNSCVAYYLKQDDIGHPDSSWCLSFNGGYCATALSLTNGLLSTTIVKVSGQSCAHVINGDTVYNVVCTYRSIANDGTLCNVNRCLKFGLNTGCFMFCFFGGGSDSCLHAIVG